MSNTNKVYIGIFGRNKVECLQLVLYGWFKHIRILSMRGSNYPSIVSLLKRIFFLKKYIGESIEEYKIGIDSYKGLYYSLYQETIKLTLEFYNQKIKIRNRFIVYYNKLLRTDKFEAYIKKIISSQIFSLLDQFHHIFLSGLFNQTILLPRSPINDFVIKYMENKYKIKYRIKMIMPLGGIWFLFIYYVWLFKEFIRRGVVFNKRRKQYKLSKELTWGFCRKTLRDDMIIDGDKFGPEDILMLEFSLADPSRRSAFKEAQERCFSTVSVPNLKININRNIFNILSFYFWLPFKIYFKLSFSHQSYLFYHLFLFHRQCFPVEILMNSYRIVCHLSTKDGGDVAETIIFNKYGTKNIIFHWSDLTVHRSWEYAFIAHNIYFVWGDIHYDMHRDDYFVDKKINVGCIFKKEFNKALKNQENIVKDMDNFDKKHKTVTFFDTSFSESLHFTVNFFLEYLEIIKEFCQEYKEVNVLFKPKDQNQIELLLEKRKSYKDLWDGLNACDNFNCLDPAQWSAEEVIAVSDVCVSMGMNSPATVALICGKNAFYFDNTGNTEHPFAKKYMNSIVFDDKNYLFKQLNSVLKEEFDCRDVIKEEEIRKYDTFSDDKALERIRDKLYELTTFPY